jgi:hypothetical protein
MRPILKSQYPEESFREWIRTLGTCSGRSMNVPLVFVLQCPFGVLGVPGRGYCFEIASSSLVLKSSYMRIRISLTGFKA